MQKCKGIYFDPQLNRQLTHYVIGDSEFTLTASQYEILQRMLNELGEHQKRGIIIPLFIEAETGTGKTQLAISASVTFFKQFSVHLNRVHSVYLSPTTFLASQASRRFTTEIEKYISGLKMLSIKGLDEDKREKIKEVFSIYLSATKCMLSTNPQFLSSLATKNARFYDLEKRSSEFELFKTLADTNILILDEVHFYQGKSLVRLLTLLLTILQSKRMSVATPTILMFLSATMGSREIDSLLYQLNESLGYEANLSKIRTDERILRIEEKERGAKHVLFFSVDNINDLQAFLLEKVSNNSSATVIYWDSIPRLVQLQELLESHGVRTAIYHAQMPIEVQQQNLDKIVEGETKILLTTSISEIGIEFETLGFQVEQMFSINTKQISKVVQRLGRLARRKGTRGMFYAIDLDGTIKPLSNTFANELTYEQGREDYPSFLEKAQSYSETFFTSYASPKADLTFSQALKTSVSKTSGEVFPIYISNSERVEKMQSNIIDETPEVKEYLYFPFWKLSAGAIRISSDQYLEFSRSQDRFLFQLREGFVHIKPFILTSIHLEENDWQFQRRSRLKDDLLKTFWKKWKILNAHLGGAKITQTIRNTHTRVIHSQIIRLEFECPDVFPKDYTFLESDFYEAFVDLIQPLEYDLLFYWQDRQGINDCLYCFEPESGTGRHQLALGAVEKLWTVLTGDVNES